MLAGEYQKPRNEENVMAHLPCVFELLICSRQRTVDSRHIFFALGLVITADVVETFLAKDKEL